MKTLVVLALVLAVSPALAVVISLDVLDTDLGTRIDALSGATGKAEKKEARSLGKARDCVETFEGAAEKDKRAQEQLAKASRHIAKSGTAVAGIAVEGQDAIRGELDGLARASHDQAEAMMGGLDSRGHSRVDRVMDKGRGRMDAAMDAWPENPPKTMKGIIKAARVFGKAVKLAGKLGGSGG